MKKLLLILGLSLGLVGCGGSGIPTRMNIEKGSNEEFLLGQIEADRGSFALQKIKFKAEGLNRTCTGTSANGQVKLNANGMNSDNYFHKFPISCSDGATGTVILDLMVTGFSGTVGTGFGELSDGSKIKISVGTKSKSVDW